MRSETLALMAALACASIAFAEGDRPRIYFPRHIKREFGNSTVTSPIESLMPPKNAPSPTSTETDGSLVELLSSILKSSKSESSSKTVSIVSTTLPDLKEPPTSTKTVTTSNPPSVILQLTTAATVPYLTSSSLSENLADIGDNTDAGILIAPAGVVTRSRTSVASPESQSAAISVLSDIASVSWSDDRATSPNVQTTTVTETSASTPAGDSQTIPAVVTSPNLTPSSTPADVLDPIESLVSSVLSPIISLSSSITILSLEATTSGEPPIVTTSAVFSLESEATRSATGAKTKTTGATLSASDSLSKTDISSPQATTEARAPVVTTSSDSKASAQTGTSKTTAPGSGTTSGSELVLASPSKPNVTSAIDPVTISGSGSKTSPITNPETPKVLSGTDTTQSPGSSTVPEPNRHSISTPTTAIISPINTDTSRLSGTAGASRQSESNSTSATPTTSPDVATSQPADETITPTTPIIAPTTPVVAPTTPVVAPTTPVKPVTSIRPTATLSASEAWLPSTIVFEPSQISYTPAPHDSTATSATGLPTNIPRMILPDDPDKNRPSNCVLIQIGFRFPLNYMFVAKNTVSAAQIFKYLPIALAEAGGFGADKVVVHRLTPYDTRYQWGYITALVTISYPHNMLDNLQLDLLTPNSALYNHEDEIIRNLTSVINTKIDIFGDYDGSGAGDNASSGNDNPQNNDAFGNDGADNQSSKQKATTAGIAVGAFGLSVMYGAAMFIVARRYKRKRQGHRRSSSIGTSERSSEMRYTGHGSPALMGGALMSRDFSSYGATNDRVAPERPGGRDSHGSGRSGMGNSARTAYISAPVAAENSLGWN